MLAIEWLRAALGLLLFGTSITCEGLKAAARPGMLSLAASVVSAWGQGGNAADIRRSEEQALQQMREMLYYCAAEVCNENSIDENVESGQLCGRIPVRSTHGGAGRTTLFGRLLWCVAQVCKGTLLDLYAGSGDMAVLLAAGLQSRQQGRKRILSFEVNQEKAAWVSARLRAQGAVVTELRPPVGEGLKMGELTRALAHKPASHQVQVLVVASSTSVSAAGSTGSVLQATVCDVQEDLDLVLLDPDVDMDPHSFAEDWRAIERCGGARLVAIYNTNLPGGAGWVKERLLSLGVYVELASGSNDGGSGEEDELYQFRSWTLLLRLVSPATPAETPASVDEPSPKEPVLGVMPTARDAVQVLIDAGASWTGSTFRAVRGGTIRKVHDLTEDLIPVELERPHSDLLSPPLPDTNPQACYAENETQASARRLRVPCFLACDGPDFDPRWAKFRAELYRNVAQGYPMDESLFMQANLLIDNIINDDTALIIGRSRFVARMRHEYLVDGHVAGLCMYGLVSALFIRARHFIELHPLEFTKKGRTHQSARVARDDLDIAYTILWDSNSKAGIEFSFLENSPWPVRLEDIMINLQAQKLQLGAPFQLLRVQALLPPAAPALAWPASISGLGVESTARAPSIDFQKPLRLCGVGDHLAATYDAVLMVEQGLQSVDIQIISERSFLGRFCPRHAGQQHQCLQKCHLLGAGCTDGADESDLLAQWLEGVIHPETLEELHFDLGEKVQSLAAVTSTEPQLVRADLIVCSHPAMLCMLLAQVSAKPIFAHASSTLLYGIPCEGCGINSTLREYNTDAVQTYLASAREMLLAGTTGGLAFMAEGRFLAEQVRQQVGVAVGWLPPLALYAKERWAGSTRRNALVLRSRFFVTLMGELLRSLLREIASINGVLSDITFLGKDNQFDEQWLTLEQMAGFGAVVLYPNDVHQRTFHEVYRMGVPLLMPDPLGLYRAQRASNWGYTSYGGRLNGLDLGEVDPAQSQQAAWWDSFTASPHECVPFQQYADWETFPHILRFSSLPSLLDTLMTADLEETSRHMLRHHESVVAQALKTAGASALGTLGAPHDAQRAAPRVQEGSRHD